MTNALVAGWCALCLLLGVWVGAEVWQLGDLATTVADAGRTLDDAGGALQSLDEVPFVGDETGRLGGEVRREAGRVVQSAGEGRASVRRLAVLLGLVVALLPTVPVLLVQQLLRRGGQVAPRR